MRVLLIEDDTAMAQSIEMMLTNEGFNIYCTDLGEEGLDLGKLYDYDIILLDLNLPDMSGYEVLKTLRLAKIGTPILILSGLSVDESGQLALSTVLPAHMPPDLILYMQVWMPDATSPTGWTASNALMLITP